MYAAGAALYQDQSVASSDPGQLVTMLYERVLVALARCAGTGELETINAELQRAQDIIAELTVTLDRERGGDIARNLETLYAFCTDRLIQANLTKNLALLEPVHAIITQLRDAWQAACHAAAVEDDR